MRERTIEHPIKCSGIGLHSGKKVSLSFFPLPTGSGVVWSVKGEEGSRRMELSPHLVVDTTLCTTIGAGGACVGTVEHVMAAVRGMEIDNLLIEVDGPEVPIMDGSAASFVHLFNQAGIVKQLRPKKVYVLTREVRLEEKDKKIVARPDDEFRVNLSIDFPHPMVGRQSISYRACPDRFVQDLARARTFGFLTDVKALQGMGKALGGSLENALVFDQSGVINSEGFRYPDEPVRHKLLDLIGDLGLLPHQVVGRFEVHCSGHALNTAFAKCLYDNMEEYLHLVDLQEIHRKRSVRAGPVREMHVSPA
jgi:UDP-3-O-[3-hydroxymyristoyl] N-acetylglucosamine deacetylase